MTATQAGADLGQRLWHQACTCLQQEAWAEAEGLLWRLLQLAPSASWELRDALGYCLLMQGSYALCEAVLRPALEAPGRSFWVSHKLADALRGQARLEEAEALYRRSEQEGSSSPFTARNHLQVLYQLEIKRCLDTLEAWLGQPDTPEAYWSGAQQAALLVPGEELSDWLWRHGLSNAACRRRLLEASCYALNPQRCWQILHSVAKASPWEEALSQRLQLLGLVATGETPAAGE
jgi:tetratricopeptide (TPR) repeat protein